MIVTVVREIAGIVLEDGIEFDPEQATAEVIREEDDYSGIRVTLGGTLSRATVRLHVDVNVGDPIWPVPQHVRVAQYRKVTLAPLVSVLVGYSEIGQTRWGAWLRKQRLETTVPAEFSVVLDYIVLFADPIIRQSAK